MILGDLYFGPEYSSSSLAGLLERFGNDPDSSLNKLYPGKNRVKWSGGNMIFSMIDRDSTLWIMTDTKIFRLVSDAFIEYDEDRRPCFQSLGAGS